MQRRWLTSSALTTFGKIHDKFRTEFQRAMYITDLVRQVLIHISRDVVYHQRACDAAPEGMELQQTISARPSPIQPVWVEAPEVTWVAKKLYDKYGERMVLSVARWYLQGIHSVTEPATWISFYQLYADYMLCHGEGGPLHCDDWTDPRDRPWSSLIGISFKVRCRWFTHLLKELWRSWGMTVTHHFTRPRSEFLVLHTSCAFVPWETKRLDCCERWLGGCLVEPARRDGKGLHKLPTPCRDPQMPKVTQTHLTIR